MVIEYYLISGTKAIRYSLAQAKKYVLAYTSILEEMNKPLSNEELEKLRIYGVYHGKNLTFTDVYRSDKGEIKFRKPVKNN